MKKKPIIIGGDFNLVRYQDDKSNKRVDFKWCDKFNEWIDKNCLLEINLLGKNYTTKPYFSLIDRVFCSIEFDSLFPFAIAKALPRNPSDHVPILWESGHG
jgi:hypothetical protein